MKETFVYPLSRHCAPCLAHQEKGGLEAPLIVCSTAKPDRYCYSTMIEPMIAIDSARFAPTTHLIQALSVFN